MAARDIPFVKMNGLDNDFVVFDAREGPVRLTREQIASFGDRATGIGFDQMIFVETSPLGLNAFMRIYNRDGGEVDVCGNATRCVGRLLSEEADTDRVSIQTNAGILRVFAGDMPERFTADMGEPIFDWEKIPLAEEFRDTRAIELQIGPIDAPVLHSPAAVSMGNPHAVFFVDRDVDSYDLARFGPLLEHHPIFPQRANISIAQIVGENEIKARVWERGVGLTLACGTGACAIAVSAARKKLTGRTLSVHLPGGPLFIDWREGDNHVYMTGDTEIEFFGRIDPQTMSWHREPEPVSEPVKA